MARVREFFLNVCLLWGSICLFLITIEFVFIILNVEPKLSLRGLYISDPVTGYTLNPNFVVKNHNWFRPYHILINSQGLRGPEFAVEKKDNLRILVLGDSIAFGVYVEDDETFCRFLEREVRKEGFPVEVLNGGVDGYSPKNSLLWFRSKGIFLEPDIVILALFVGNDVKGELREVASFVVRDGLLYYENPSTNDEEKTSPNVIYNWLRTRRIYQFICHKYWNVKKILDQKNGKEKFIFSEIFDRGGFPREEEAYEKLMTSIRGLAETCQKREMRVLIVLVPTFEQVNFHDLNIEDRGKYDMKRPNQKVVSMIKPLGIPVLDLLEANDFQIKKDLYLHLERIHLSVEGHKVVAKNLYTFLRERGFLRAGQKMVVNSRKSAPKTSINNYPANE